MPERFLAGLKLRLSHSAEQIHLPQSVVWTGVVWWLYNFPCRGIGQAEYKEWLGPRTQPGPETMCLYGAIQL